MTHSWLTGGERSLLAAVAAAALPAGELFAAAGARTIGQAEAMTAGWPAPVRHAWRGWLHALDTYARTMRWQGFAGLSQAEQLSVLQSWADHEIGRIGLRALLAPIKLCHFDDPEIHAAVGCRYELPPATAEKARWQARLHRSEQFDARLELEADVVVVGSGAGGAVVAKELAEQGHAVVLIEEGGYFGREDFTGKSTAMLSRLYRNGGVTFALGNVFLPVPIGKTVGGTTTINSGTCLRAPEATLARWRAQSGLADLTSADLAPYFRKVESILQVAPSSEAAIGAPGRVVARACEKLGWSHHPLPRNAPGCDGQGLCCFGCPSGAKRSTNVSYVPLALQKGAELYAGMRAEALLLDGETAVGVAGHFAGAGGQQLPFEIRAKVVVLACGALHTPALLLRLGLCNASGQVGRNLSVHPASAALGIFDEPIHGLSAVPQGYCVDQFAQEGILFEGASSPLPITAASHTGFGPGFVRAMEQFDRALMFGFMIRDSSRGRVFSGVGGEPAVHYSVNDQDRAAIQRAHGLLWRLLLAAGARQVHTGVHGFETVATAGEIDAFERAKPAARHFDLSAYHPLGTCKMGSDPWRSVVDGRQESHDVHNLWICDGSALPGALGVNPQVTIMALATRSAAAIGRRLERMAAAS